MTWTTVPRWARASPTWAPLTAAKVWAGSGITPTPPSLPANVITNTAVTDIVKGSNLVPHPEQFTTPGAWAGLWEDWRWATWMQPQIDAVAALGANTIRLFGSQKALFQGRISAATYWARWQQFLDYTVSVGLSVYPSFGDMQAEHWDGSVPVASVNAAAADWAAMLAASGNCIGVDITNEAFLNSHYSQPAGPTYGLDCLAGMMVAVAAEGIPVTQDRVAVSSGDWAGSSGDTFPTTIQDLCDFHDWHCYHDGVSAANVAAFRAKGAYASGPLVFGEFGASLSLTGPQRAARYTDTSAVVSGDTTVRGSLQWGAADQGVTDDLKWGLFDNTFTARSDIATPYAAFPVTR